MLVADLDVAGRQHVFEVGAVECTHPLERGGLRCEPHTGAVGAHQAQTTTLDDFGGERRGDGPCLGAVEGRCEHGEQLLHRDAVVQTVNGVDAELVADELGHVGERELGGRVVAVLGADFIAERAADGVAVMAVGDEHRVRADCRSDGRHSLRMRDTLHDVQHTGFVAAGAHRLTRLAQQIREAFGQ